MAAHPVAKRSTTRRVHDLHTFAGLAIGAVLAFISLTGSAAVFHRELDWLFTPALRVTPRASRTIGLDAAHRIARASRSHRRNEYLWELRRPEGPRFAYTALFRQNRTLTEVFIDPYTGRVTGHRALELHPSSAAYAWRQLHVRLWLGIWGRALVGLMGLALVALSLTGWWLTRRRLGGPRRARGTARTHLTTGRLTLWFHLALGLTGSVLGLEVAPTLIDRLGHTPVTSTKPLVRSQQAPLHGPEVLDLDHAAYLSERLASGTVIRSVRPTEKPHLVAFQLDHPRSPLIAHGASTVFVDLYSGRYFSLEDIRAAPLASRLYASLDPLHFGYFAEALGPFADYTIRVVWSLLGLTPALLFITGTLAFRRRTLRLSARRDAKSLSTPLLDGLGAARSPSRAQGVTSPCLDTPALD